MTASKIVLVESREHPCCAACDSVLDLVRWHKVRGGPTGNYLIVLSCPRCGATCASLGSEDASVAVIGVVT